MAKDRGDGDKKEKKDKSKSKHSETNGVSKSKSDKKDKKRSRESVGEPVVDIDGDTVIREAADVPTAVAAAVVKEDEKETTGKNAKPIIIGASVPFANPMADEKTMRKVLKGVKKAAKNKTLRRGVKEVVKSLRKSSTTPSKPPHALVVLAADISPFDVISHIPVLCEDHHVPYIYVPSRAELGAAGSTKRPTSVVMVVPTIPQKKKQELEKAGKDKDGKDDKEDWSETYADLSKVIEKAGRDVRI